MTVSAYKDLCQKSIEDFLVSGFICHDPNELDDATIILDASERSQRWTHEGKGFLSQTRQFCSIMKVDGVFTNLYHPDTYVEVLRLCPMNFEGIQRIEIPFNHFQYPMMLDQGITKSFDNKEAKYVCTFDDKHDRDSIVSNCSNLILYSYYLGGITKFNQKRYLYRLVSFTPETLVGVIRNELLKARYISLEYLTKYPEYCRPDSFHMGLTYTQAAGIMKDITTQYASQIDATKKLVHHSLNNSDVIPEYF